MQSLFYLKKMFGVLTHQRVQVDSQFVCSLPAVAVTSPARFISRTLSFNGFIVSVSHKCSQLLFIQFLLYLPSVRTMSVVQGGRNDTFSGPGPQCSTLSDNDIRLRPRSCCVLMQREPHYNIDTHCLFHMLSMAMAIFHAQSPWVISKHCQ